MANTDVVSQTINIGGNTIIIYNNRKPDSYLESDIFDPNNPSDGKYFPSMFSIVIKQDGSLWYVSSRDEINYKVTLSPCNIITDGDAETSAKIVSYGNDKYCLYMDTRVSPYKLIVDAKVLFYGNSLKEYTLTTADENGEERIISMYLDSTDKFVSDRIPMASISPDIKAYKFPTNCHTTANLTEGDVVTLTVYNNLGNVAATLTLYVRNAVWLNDLNSWTNPIVEFNVESLQTRGNEFYIKERQDPSHLNLRPYLVYADGSKAYVNIDNTKCFMYGLDDFIPAYPGYSQTLIFKYFLGRNETALNTTEKFLTCSKELVVIKDKSDYSFKVSVVPLYNNTLSQWYLKFFLYTDDRNACYDITDQVTYDEDFPFVGSYDKWGIEQHVVIDYDVSVALNLNEEMPGSQSFWITVWDPNTFERYTFKDNEDSDFVYGVDGSITRRPVLHYDRVLDVYYIPTSIFHNKEAVIESFYTLSRPFFDTRTESVAPTPTHFIVRDSQNGQQLISSPVDLDDFGKAMNFIGNDRLPSGGTVIVEFLQLIMNTYVVLYGVPVDVYVGTYNTENN